jgi:hypothetical protein
VSFDLFIELNVELDMFSLRLYNFYKKVNLTL